jgi:hypothetical protein
MSIRDYLQDIVQHTFVLGNIVLVKITGDENETVISALADDRSVLVSATTKKVVPEFIGQFGMPNLNKLNVILGIPEYKENAKVTVTSQERNGTSVLSGLHFENKSGDFKNDYRFMSAELVNEQLKTVKFKGVKWDVEFAPAVQNINRLKFMSSANSEETTFIAKTEKDQLKFYFGDHSSHAGNFVFADAVSGAVSKGYHWPVAVIQSILNLPGDKVYRISDEGATQITVDSGLVDYCFTLPAMQK